LQNGASAIVTGKTNRQKSELFMKGSMNARGIWSARGGSGDRTVLLLHGLAANASVWRHFVPAIEKVGFRWIAPDFRGHGYSVQAGSYGYGNHAADIGDLVAEEDLSTMTILGHSFGGAIGALLGTGLFGPLPARIVALGVKVNWSNDELDKARTMASRSSKVFPIWEEAATQYLKLSGLLGIVELTASETAHGVHGREGGFSAAVDPRVFSAVGPSIDAMFRQVKVPLRLAAGSNDPMTSLDVMRQYDESAVELVGFGHNVHVESVETLLELFLRECDRDARPADSGEQSTAAH
jgi:pimeloyl-ACP methyl ester carboxylesterase